MHYFIWTQEKSIEAAIKKVNSPRVPARVVTITKEVLLSCLLILGLGEDAGEQGNQNEKTLQVYNRRCDINIGKSLLNAT